MISVTKVITERNQDEPLPRAQPVKAQSDRYINDRISTLKRAFASGRVPSQEYQQQLKELIKNRLTNPSAGVTQFP
jgi:hypothetical protein